MVAGVDKNRRLVVPGEVLEVSYVVGGKPHNSVLAIYHADRVVMIFYGNENGTPTACSMTVEQAKRFSREIRETYQAVADDVTIDQLEREFGEE